MSSGTPARAKNSELIVAPASNEAPASIEAPASSEAALKVLDPRPSVSSTGSTIAPSQCTTSSSEWSLSANRQHAKAIPWGKFRLGHRIQPVHRHAHSTDDIYLLVAFLDLANVPDLDGNSVKLLLRTLRLLHRCSYSAVDICSILAHASSYFIDVFGLCGNYMDATEVGNVLVTMVFLAHSYIQDETCPLHVWHQYLFRGYCPLKKLSEAIMRVMAIRKYVLRVEEKDLNTRYETLCAAMRVPLVDQVC